MKELKIKILAKFGSEFQESFAYDSLTNMLKAYMNYVNNSHKRNILEIEFGKKFEKIK